MHPPDARANNSALKFLKFLGFILKICMVHNSEIAETVPSIYDVSM